MNNSLRSFLSQIFYSSDSGYLLIDSESLNILVADEKFETLLNYEFLELSDLSLNAILTNGIHLDFQKYSELNPNEILNELWIFETKTEKQIPIEITIRQLSHPENSERKVYLILVGKLYQDTNWLNQDVNSFDLLNRIDIPIFSLNQNLDVAFANSSARKTLGFNDGDLKKFDFINIISSDPEFRQSLLTDSMHKQVQLTDKNGKTLHMLFQSSLLRNKEGKFKGLMILLFDFSDLKKAEQNLRNSEERLRTIFATMNNGIVMVNEKGIIQEIAPIFKFLLFQFIPLEKGDFIFSFLEEELQKSCLSTLNDVTFSTEPKTKEFNYKILDNEYTFEVRFIPIRRYIDLERVIMLVFTDRSEAKRLDRQLIESMKFASIGEIAAGLAHEINNPLQSALLYLDDLIVAGEDDPTERKMILKKIESANLRIRDLVRALLDLGRVESQTRDLVSPYYILVRSSELVEVSCKKKGIEFYRHAGPNLPGIIVRWQEIEQVLINCVVNSINALSEMEQPIPDPRIEIGIDLLTMNKKDWVVFSIEDNGPGMSEEIMEKAFLPLFTTRRKKQGTGLGLSISKKIINDHDGEIIIKSKLGVGTKIEILLPAQVDKND
jgi:signal transduction histidine kinase